MHQRRAEAADEPHAEARAREVIGEKLRLRVDQVREARRQLMRDAVVIATARVLGQRSVRHFLRQRVREQVGRRRGAPANGHELPLHELADRRVEVRRLVPDRPEQQRGHFASAHRGDLQDVLRLAGQLIDPRHEDVLDRVWHARLGYSGIAPHDARHLLEEERIALGLGHDHVREYARHAIGRQDGLEQRFTLLGRQVWERNLHRVGPVHPRRPVPRPVRREEQDRRARKILDERCEKLLGRLVDPL